MADAMSNLAASVTSTPASPTTAPNPVDAYKNPFTKDVLDSAMGAIDKTGVQRRNQLGTEAFNAGAFGDGRHGVEDANLTTDLATAKGTLAAQVNGDAYDKAMGWLNTDTDRQTNTALANANLDNQWQANQLGQMSLGNSIYQSNLTNGMSFADALKSLGDSNTATAQNKDNVAYDDWLTKNGYDKAQLTDFMNFMQGTPGQTSTSTTSTPPPSTDWASMLGSSLSSLFKK